MQFFHLQMLFISMKIYIVVTDVVMTFLVPAEIVMQRVVIALFMTQCYPPNNSNVMR